LAKLESALLGSKLLIFGSEALTFKFEFYSIIPISFMMERLMQSCDSMPSRNDSVRKLNFSTSIAAGITIEEDLIAARCRMLPTQKREISDVTKDDTRDDAFVASKPRVAYRWSHSDTSPSTSSHDRMPVIRAADRVSGARAYVARRLQGHPIWNQSSGWHSMRNVDSNGSTFASRTN
jgi:hypothetical protein